MRFIIATSFQLLFLISCINSGLSSSFFENANNFLKELGISRTRFNFNEARNGRLLVTNLDRFRGLYVMGRRLSLWQTLNEFNELYQNNRENGKMQKIIANDIPFPCNLSNARSIKPPISVNQIRPGDIDIIAAFGDSLSAGNGIMSSNILHILNEHRSFVFSGGGYGNWRNTLTLPNILKVYNPNLYGYATNDGLTVDGTSHFNIAEPMLMSRDLPYQAKILISRLRQDPNVNMKNHWKLLTILIGANDICSDMCHYDHLENFIKQHEKDLRRTLTILRDQVPRLLVNILPASNMVTTLYTMRNIPFACEAVHSVGCHCVISQRYNTTYMRRISKYIYRWQKVDKLMAELSEFQTDDFAVIYHPFSANPPLLTLKNGDTDLRYFASDCFHFSQLGHACLANTLWNSMLQPIDHKQTYLTPAFEHFECPNEERPYIATIGNS